VSIHSSDPTFSSTYATDNVLTLKECETHTDGSYFLGPESLDNHKIIFDFGCALDIQSVSLFPTSNGGLMDWGVKDFIMEMSLDAVNWHVVLEDTLGQPLNSCDRTPGNFPIVMYGRYIRLTTVTYYAYGTGLQFIQFHS